MIDIFINGGPLMYPILLCSIIGWAIFFERIRTYRKVRKGMQPFLKQVKELLISGNTDEAVNYCRENPSPLARIFSAVLTAEKTARSQIKDLAEEVGGREIVELQRFLGLLSTIANIAPLLGLLGTVLGMIEAFNVIATQGVGTPATLGGGISEALITTAAGLSVAVPMILIHRYLTSRADRLVLEMEDYTMQVVDLVAE